MGIAESIAFVSAAIKAIEFYERHGGGSSAEFLTTLNLNYNPDAYVALQRSVLTLDAEHKDLFESLANKAKQCIKSMTQAIDDDPFDRDYKAIADRGRRCVCSRIGRFKELYEDALPDELKDLWRTYKCDELA